MRLDFPACNGGFPADKGNGIYDTLPWWSRINFFKNWTNVNGKRKKQGLNKGKCKIKRINKKRNSSTWKTVTRAQSKESKFLRSQVPDAPSFSLSQNLQPNKFIPRILKMGIIVIKIIKFTKFINCFGKRFGLDGYGSGHKDQNTYVIEALYPPRLHV